MRSKQKQVQDSREGCGLFGADEEDARQLSEMLVCDFLAIEREGYQLCKTISLFGGESAVIEGLAREMTAQFVQKGMTGVRVEFQDRDPREYSGKYWIDVSYFLRRKLP